ncbi:MAG TPA: SusD/RagB family nutrient-binding outer membrane lipoprotein [Parapedobacter sp.]|nr:SusD/RagB family nutrient-binding outer membrane lipoprotein [Parapedobacter sp.]
MRQTIKILSLALLIVGGSACTKDITRFNTETKNAAVVPAGPLFTGATKSMCDGLVSAAVGTNIYRHFVKHWAQAVIQEEAQYDFVTRATHQSWWARMYRDVLNDLKESARIITEDNSMDPKVKANQLAVIDVMQVFAYNILVNTFGNIPYSQALDADNLFPVYDDARTIYVDLLNRLAQDVSMMDASGAGFSASEDLFYQGNMAKWIAFANSLRIKMAMTIADVDNELAKSTFEAANEGAIASPDGDAILHYYPATPNNNPLYNQLVLAGRTDFIAAKDLMDVLIAQEDPRKSQFFGVNDQGEYVGGVVGVASNFSGMSKPSAKVAAPDAPFVLMDYMETEFYRAEAKERGYAISGTAAEHYGNAIEASIRYWGGTVAEAQTYLQRTDVAYATATGNWHQKIGAQKWIALYNRPFAGWTELRRLDYPELPLAVDAISGFPNRMLYPGNEQQLNADNYAAAAAAIGGDNVETKLFWDVN